MGTRTRDNLRVGRADTTPTRPSHVHGVAEGNALGNYEAMDGHLPDGRSTARRSTGINADSSNAILPEMPNLSPA